MRAARDPEEGATEPSPGQRTAARNALTAGKAKRAEPEDEGREALKLALAVGGGLVSGAAWVALVGAAVFLVRLSELGVASFASVALIPDEHRLLVGARFAVPPLLLALLFFVLALSDRSRLRRKRRHNEPGHLPRALLVLGLVLTGVAIYVVIRSESIPDDVQGYLVPGVVLLAVGTGYVIKQIDGYFAAAGVWFAAVALSVGAFAYVYERFRPTRLDLAAVVRTDGSVISGFYLSSSDKGVLLVEAIRPLRPKGIKPRRTEAPLGDGLRRCKREEAVSAFTDGEDCYFNDLVTVPDGQVAKLVLGPRSVRVDAAGYDAARALATRAKERIREIPAPAEGDRNADSGLSVEAFTLRWPARRAAE